MLEGITKEIGVDEPATLGGTETLEQILGTPVRVRSVALTLLLGVAIVAVLRFTRGLFLPIVLAVLVQFVLQPLVRMLRVIKIPTAIGAALVLLTLLGLSGYGLYRVYDPALAWVKEAPQTLQQVKNKLSTLKGPVEHVRRATEQVADIASLADANADEPVVRLQRPGIAERFLANLSELATSAVFALVLAYFLLANEGIFLNRAAALLTGATEEAIAADGMKRIQNQISTYLLTITIINAVLGAVVGLIMYATGIPNPVLWGIMAGVLTFVPYLGAVAGVGIVSIVALVTFDSFAQAMIPPLLYAVAAVLEGMIITPMVLGYRLTLSPVAIFIWLLLLNWLWGIPGAVIAVPILVIIKILCDNERSLEGFGRLLERSQRKVRHP